MKNNQSVASQYAKNAFLSGMTFNPSIDCRNDLVNFYGYTQQQVSKMSDDEVFSIMDRIEAQEKGYDFDEYETSLPEAYKNEKCSCGGSLKVLYVDCETRGDCEIYVCECTKCKKERALNYAEEWFEEPTAEDTFFEMLIDIDNACFNKSFNKANERAKKAYDLVLTIESDQQWFFSKLAEKLNNLSKRYNMEFNLA